MNNDAEYIYHNLPREELPENSYLFWKSAALYIIPSSQSLCGNYPKMWIIKNYWEHYILIIQFILLVVVH